MQDGGESGKLLMLAERGDKAKAYYLLKALGLTIADLQEVCFTETDLKPLMEGWREVQRRIEISNNGVAPVEDSLD